MCSSNCIDPATLSKAIHSYETHGAVTERTTKLGRSAFRKLLQEMKNAGCNNIEEAVETTVVIGDYEEYFEVIYNGTVFQTDDEAKNYILKFNI